MSSTVTGVLHLLSWVLFCVILLFLALIGRFYERKAYERTLYKLYILPIFLYLSAGVVYAFGGDDFVGDLWGDALLTLAGLITIGLVEYLFTTMMGGRR